MHRYGFGKQNMNAHLLPRTGDLCAPDGQRQQFVEWLAERLGWVAMGCILAAASIGLLGPGAASRRHRQSTDNRWSMDYSAIERRDAPTQMQLRLASGAVGGRTTRLTVSRSLADEIVPENIVPMPLATYQQGDGLTYVFQTEPGEALQILIRHKHPQYGWLKHSLAVEDGPPLQIGQFVLP